jgi:hypothetical protein
MLAPQANPEDNPSVSRHEPSTPPEGSEPSLATKPVVGRTGGQSGTDSEGAYTCSREGATRLASVPLDQEPEGISCAPATVLAAVSGTYEYDCRVSRAIRVADDELGNPQYIYPNDPGPSVTLQMQPGAAAHLLAGVATGEDGRTSWCRLLDVDVSVSITGADGGIAVSAESAFVDRFCATAGITANTRLRLFGTEEDASLRLWIDAQTGRIIFLALEAQTYAVNCVD